MGKLRDKRLKEGLSQTRLAAKAGVNPATVNQIERGARTPSALTLQKLANALGVGIEEIFEEITEGEPAPLAAAR